MAGHMSDPFTIDEVHVIFDGHFRTPPVGLVEKVPGDRKWQMIWHLSKTDCEGFLTNLSLDSHDCLTMYFSAADVAAWVSTVYPYSLVSGTCLLLGKGRTSCWS